MVNATFDDHMTPHDDVTLAQLTLAVAALASTLLYVSRLFHRHLRPLVDRQTLPGGDNSGDALIEAATPPAAESKVELDDKVTSEIIEVEPKKNFSKVPTPPSVDEFLSHVIQFSIILIVFWISDYRKGFPAGERVYSEDVFLFLIFILFLVSISFTTKTTQDVILNRDQTEEWKGWMQVMFVWYHYFHAFNWYNWIRVYIAAYVWMTGFGNFSFFWLKQDYSLWRITKMLFRLNFFVLALCATLHNDYILYYICAMHTYWFLSVYVTMAIAPSYNSQPRRMLLKFVIYAVVNFAIFDVANVAEVVFKPLAPVLGYTDDSHTIMHEWVFRAGLDHWACFIGMVCAYNYPHYEAFLRKLEKKVVSQVKVNYSEHATKLLYGGTIAAVLYVWYQEVMTLDKFDYNRVHPYTSWMPVVGFAVLRNLYPTLRTRYVLLFNWLGKITLETYLTQLHLYLQSNAKQLIIYIPKYPLLNFSLATIIYLMISHRVFHVTVCFSAFLIPHDARLMKRNLIAVAALLLCSGIVAFLAKWL